MMHARSECLVCSRPSVVCICAHITQIETKTRVVLLQHPREASVAIGTARIAHQCLQGSVLKVGVKWDETQLAFAHADAERPPMLLYPGEDAIDLGREPPAHPITLVVIDGTWSQTKKLVKENAALRALPRVAFTPDAPSEYRIRREPKDEYVSTIEALTHVLGLLEGDALRFAPLLVPFRKMVDVQIGYVTRVHAGRVRKKRNKVRKHSVLPDAFTAHPKNHIYIVAESNAWPFGSKERESSPHGEMVHLVAWRDGERFEHFVDPKSMHAGALAPHTLSHLALEEADLEGAMSLETLRDLWRAFVQEGDVLVCWGTFSLHALRRSELASPQAFDVRHLAHTNASLTATPRGKRASIGGVQEFAASLSKEPAPACGKGRAGRRLGALVAIANRWLKHD